MTRHEAERIGAHRYKEASEWLVRLNVPDVPEGDLAAWLRWCEEHPENLVAFERLQRDWRDIAAIRAQVHSSRVAGLRSGDLRPAESAWKWTRSFAAAAAVAALAIALATVGHDVLVGPAKGKHTHNISAQETNRTEALSDGSILTLSPRSMVRVDYGPNRRRVALREGGDAYVKVQRDRSRPFVVEAGALIVTAIGTAFDVRHEADRVFVTVEEGIVEVASPATHSRWTVSAGGRLEYSERSGTASIARVDPKSALQWTSGEFAYVATPLAAVVADINRYSGRTVTLGDERVGEIPFTGTLFVRSLDAWLQALASKYPVRVTLSGQGDAMLDLAQGRNDPAP